MKKNNHQAKPKGAPKRSDGRAKVQATGSAIGNDRKPQGAPERTRFLGGVVKAADVEGLKPGILPRFVFAGRSNVGKSSLLNALTGLKVARVSREPGKTREMNFFRYTPSRDLKDQCLLVDLPGYGYARVATELRQQWGKEITAWIKGDPHVRLVLALVDGRHGYLANDVELVEFLKSSALPFLVVFTKMDKYKSANQRRQGERLLTDLSARLGVERYIFVSAESKNGVRPLELAMREILRG